MCGRFRSLRQALATGPRFRRCSDAALTAFLAETARLVERARTSDELLALFAERKVAALQDKRSMFVMSMATSLLGDDATGLVTSVRDAAREYGELLSGR